MPNQTPSETMPWKCLDCRALFVGPTDRTPEAGCPVCASSQVIDINVTPISAAEARKIEQAVAYLALQKISRPNRFQLMFGRSPFNDQDEEQPGKEAGHGK